MLSEDCPWIVLSGMGTHSTIETLIRKLWQAEKCCFYMKHIVNINGGLTPDMRPTVEDVHMVSRSECYSGVKLLTWTLQIYVGKCDGMMKTRILSWKVHVMSYYVIFLKVSDMENLQEIVYVALCWSSDSQSVTLWVLSIYNNNLCTKWKGFHVFLLSTLDAIGILVRGEHSFLSAQKWWGGNIICLIASKVLNIQPSSATHFKEDITCFVYI